MTSNDKIKLIPKTGGGYTVISADSKDDLPIFDPKGNILNENARNGKQFGYQNEVEHKRELKKALQLVHTKQRFQYKGNDIVSAADNIVTHLKNSNNYKIKLLEQSSNKLFQFINRLVQLGLKQIDIDANGTATLIYVKQATDNKSIRKWEFFLDNCEALYGNSLEYLDKDNDGNLVYRLLLGTKEIMDESVE